MRHTITYTPTKEVMNQLRPKQWGIVVGDAVAQARAQLILYSMLDHKPEELNSVYTNVYFYLKGIYNAVKDKFLERICDEFDNDGHIEFHDNDMWGTEWELNDYIARFGLKLSEFALIIKTADYLEDSQRFVDKQSAIEEEIDDFVDGLDSIIQHEIQDKLVEYKTGEEETD